MDNKLGNIVTVLTTVFIGYVFCLPVTNEQTNVKAYLSTFGYSSSSQSDITQSLKEFQYINKLPVTGLVDKDTVTLMSEPRCGNSDSNLIEQNLHTPNSTKPRPAAFKLFATENKWKKNKINWYITQYTNQLSQDDQREAFRRALQKWADVSNLEFVEQRQDVDIEIKFVRGDHGDDSKFDGPSVGRKGTILAHAFAPGGTPLAGDAHFDNDEQWTADVNNKNTEKKFLEVIAAHEFGHALGLEHSQFHDALMSAYYVNSQREYELSEDDINGIQHLYGAPSGWEPRTTPEPTTPPPIPVCHNLFKAVVWGRDKRTYGIYNDRVLELSDKKHVLSIPRSLQEIFPNSPIGVDFATTLPDSSSTYMFRGYSVWKFNGYELDKNYPTMFDVTGFPEMPIGIFSIYEKDVISIYLYGRSVFWSWNPDTDYRGKSYRYHQTASYWSQELARFELITTWNNGDLYLINRDSHVLLKNRKVVEGYPKEGVPVWVKNGCRSGSSRLQVHIPQFISILVLIISYLFV